jgi:hypothetical protein
MLVLKMQVFALSFRCDLVCCGPQVDCNLSPATRRLVTVTQRITVTAARRRRPAAAAIEPVSAILEASDLPLFGLGLGSGRRVCQILVRPPFAPSRPRLASEPPRLPSTRSESAAAARDSESRKSELEYPTQRLPVRVRTERRSPART